MNYLAEGLSDQRLATGPGEIRSEFSHNILGVAFYLPYSGLIKNPPKGQEKYAFILPT